MITQERLKELLTYDPETGVFTWRVSRNGNLAQAGAAAGAADAYGYRVIRIDRRNYKAHRLAFLYMTGEIPPDCVDHVNRDRADNRWENLRLATRRENQGNTGIRRNNTSGRRGVTWDKSRGKWQARGASGGRLVFLGRFDSLEEASAVVSTWREAYFGEFAAA